MSNTTSSAKTNALSVQRLTIRTTVRSGATGGTSGGNTSNPSCPAPCIL